MSATTRVIRAASTHRYLLSIIQRPSILNAQPQDRFFSTAEKQRLLRTRNVGIFAHVDAGKTTVTERMLALAGIVSKAGRVDDGDTVTDFLPAERERGITIQSAAISFEWGWHNRESGYIADDHVTISLIDTPGHVDFSVEVNRSVAVLDGAVLVVDAAVGVQAQTETVWRAMTKPSLNNHEPGGAILQRRSHTNHAHEPLPCISFVNKMDKEGSNFTTAVASIRTKLPGANPVPVQLPIFRTRSGLTATASSETGQFVGVVDLVHMRAIVWPDSGVDLADVDMVVPDVWTVDEDDALYQDVRIARHCLVEAMADVDEHIGEHFLEEIEPTNSELRHAIRRATLARHVLPVLVGTALRGKGIEPLLDCIADLLPCPLDRGSPALTSTSDTPVTATKSDGCDFGHALHPSLLALAFKVIHMKGRGGSGDGRVVFARVYSGEIRERDTVRILSPPPPGEDLAEPRVERVGGLLELAGGRFGKLKEGRCKSGSVCALVGLKNVVTGDTILAGPDSNKRKRNQQEQVVLAGISSPKPVLTVRLETETAQEQTKLSEALELLCVEDPSLAVEDTDSATLLSGLGELHVEIVLDRIRREHGLNIIVGAPSVHYRETLRSTLETDGLAQFDRVVGEKRMQASVHVVVEPCPISHGDDSVAMILAEPTVCIDRDARAFLEVDPDQPEDKLATASPLVNALIQGCRGALMRGPSNAYPMANIRCRVVNIDAESGLTGLKAMPGALRAAVAHIIAKALADNAGASSVLEPIMSVEITLPSSMVGTVLSDITGRRGTVDEVVATGEGNSSEKALLRCQVPLVEILGYATVLRSLTAGEGNFTAEYHGHAPVARYS